MLAFFIAGSFWLWAATILFIIIEFAFIYKEFGWYSTTILIVYVALIIWAFDAPLITYIGEHPFRCLLYALGYLIIGTLWSFFKWLLKVNNYVKKYNKQKAKYEKQQKELRANKYKFICYEEKPEAKEYKSKFAQWVTYWPISMLIFLCEDAFVRLINWIVNKFSKIYESIEKKAYKKLN